ncbi:hypothetical protein ABFS82_09G052000 [Erythranthe guttata]|uniref:carbon catabolite repressor protein 4 homolog 5 isoform X2 n=1 Tax=Erythranthe guttata TaxID=4155 RepID=UPI00064DED5A|nr:PREDICTED: carbon catabolite repressor protein 4 homolog 5 isoform X2 [Erythranthe guttata]|eukprot:XP_012842578.1 PREDICTED: carbon catabolite repressor protein 4 homolog 5 isoform X2 [Erythranthe guttata]
MGDSGDSPSATAEHSSPNSLGKRPHRHDKRSRKKRKLLLSSETETCIRIQTIKPDSTRTFCSYTRKHTDSHFQRQDRIRTKSRRNHSWQQRKWTYSQQHHLSNYKDRVVIVSYNILGVENSTKHPELYRDVSPKYLDWEYRKKILCKEVKGYQPSILCFQEVDHFDDLNEILAKDGFRGVYKARGGETCDGCAIFWKTELFTLLHEENIEFQRFGLRNNVAQFCVLKMNQDPSSDEATERRSSRATTSRSLLVGNTHVLYNPKRGDIKLGQMRVLLEKAYELSQEWGCIPTVITGDLNSLPQSAMYQFLASSKLHIHEHDRKEISGQIIPSTYTAYRSPHYMTRHFKNRWTDEEIMLATGSKRSCVKHHLNLCSAYAEVPGSSNVRDEIGEPLATSYHSLFSGTVDYIWHTLDLVPVKVLETLPMHTLEKTGGLPSKEWGSDHLAVVCELAFTDEGLEQD